MTALASGRPALAAAVPPAILVLGIFVGLGLVPAVAESGYQVDIARQALYAACLTATWSLLAGVAGQFSFGHVAIAGVAAYVGAIWGRELAGTPFGEAWVATIVGALAALVLGATLGVILLRLRGAYLALFTLAFSEIARIVIATEVELTGGNLSLAVGQLPGDRTFHYYLMAGVLLAVLGLIYIVLGSRLGLFLRAMREDADAAAAMAVNTVRLKVVVFSFASLLLGLSASVYYHTTPRLTPQILDLLGMGLVVVYAVIGGLESPLAGAIAAAILVWLLDALRIIEIGPVHIEPGVWRYAIFGALLVLTLRLAPNGLIAPIGTWMASRVRRLLGPKTPTIDPASPDAGEPQTGAIRETPAPEPAGKGSSREMALSVEGVVMRFGGLAALDGVTLTLERPQIVGLIGPNGAGKTTLVNVLSGYYRPTGGAVILNGERVDGLPPYEMVRRGLGRTFQITRSFRRLTVLENLLVPELAINPARGRRDAEDHALAALDIVGLRRMAGDYARSLSGGQQKLLELARLIMLDSDILFLDEPFAGVHPVLRRSIGDLIRRIRTDGRAVVLIEHDLGAVFELCERLVVLDGGVVIADGDPEPVRRDPRVIAAYLGQTGTPATEAGRIAPTAPGLSDA
ncbi:MAG: branched-chain amino acid ABC transporter ATP-binding protein/permease [Chloroflexi bacterium]|nr:branched-chain amino acid ABC transporter ATP-binding protein/permease [Chloroflexota bacterium]